MDNKLRAHRIDLGIEVRKYGEGYREQWEAFIDSSANGTFLHRRSFMEYHGERFEDASLMVLEGEELLAVFPAHQVGDQIFSHQGLSFGGWIVKRDLDLPQQKLIVKSTLEYFKEQSITKVDLKTVPEFYHSLVLSPEVFQNLNGRIYTSNIFTHVISLPQTIKDRGKRWGVRKAVQYQLCVKEEEIHEFFWKEILEPQHMQQLGRPPVHQWHEIQYLSERHPNRISLLSAYGEGNLLAGMVLFKHDTVLKVQYTASTLEGKNKRAVDFLMKKIMENMEFKYLDLGTSIDPYNNTTKKSLAYWKESFGAKEFPLTTYQISLI